MKKIINNSCLWLLALLPLAACSDMNDLHQPFLDKGEKIYAAKINKAVARPGNERVQLDLFYTAQRINKCCIYWNVRQDSLVVDMPELVEDSVPVILPNMPEGNYSFEIVSQDKYVNRSLTVETNGRSYGSNYIGSLSNIRIESINSLDDKTIIQWRNIEFGSSIKFTYDVIDGGKNTITIPIIIGTTTELINALPGGSYSYVTSFKPTEDAIDEFTCMDTVTGTFPE